MSEANADKPPHLQDFIFYRELSEIYLLLDHISGRWDKSFYTDKPSDRSCLDGPDWLQRVCQIGWPPPADNSFTQAQQAAALFCAKDKLNAAARPANGASIAFTLMVIGEDTPDEERWTTRWLPRPTAQSAAGAGEQQVAEDDGAAAGTTGGGGNGGGGAGGGSGGNDDNSGMPSRPPPNRIALAHIAFPGLIGQAASFTVRMRRILRALALWLVFTCLLSWDVAAGNVILGHLDMVHAQRKEIEKKIADLESKVASPTAPDGAHSDASAERKTAATAGAGSNSAAPTRLMVRYCEQSMLLGEVPVKSGPRKTIAVFHDADELHLCDARAANEVEHDTSSSDLESWLGFWRTAYRVVNIKEWPAWKPSWWKTPPPAQASQQTPQQDADRQLAADKKDACDEETGRIVALLLGGSVLPLCYGILGAGAAIVRDLWAKMRESLLSPRDYTLALGQLALGATIGACIGLFVSPGGGATPQAEGALVATWGLSASALSFVAGFGVESVFVALESLVRRVFNTPDPSKRTQ